MNSAQYDLVVIGGGPAGLAGAISSYQQGVKKICIIEREAQCGGILHQCIHNGFGLHTFHEELTGPEYAYRWIEQLKDTTIDVFLHSTVINITKNNLVTIVNQEGITQIQSQSVLLAMGCRERTRGSIMTPGYRPAGIYTAGTAQKLVNINGNLPGKQIVIVGSGDIGLIMARRMTLEGAKVELVTEIMPYSSGLARNIVQCLDDFSIPIQYQTTVTMIHGKYRVEGVTIAQVDSNRNPIIDTERYIACDTVLFSVGLIPENELSKQVQIAINPTTAGPFVNEILETSQANFFACGNVVHVHDLVDSVSQEATRAGIGIAQKDKLIKRKQPVMIEHVDSIRYTVPQRIDYQSAMDIVISFRTTKVMKNVQIQVYSGGELLLEVKKPILTPGEMSSVLLKETLYSKIKDDLVIHLEEEN